MKKRIFLDYNASHPIRDSLLSKIPYYCQIAYNPSSTYDEGRYAKGLLEKARQSFQDILCSKNCIFTSSASEANNLAVRLIQKKYPHMFVSAGEHPSMLYAVQNTAQNYTIIPLLENGTLDYEELEKQCHDCHHPKAVIVQAANNETGVMHDMARLHSIVKECAKDYDSVLLSDITQTFGRYPIAAADHMCKFIYTASAHKIGAMHGAGILVSNFTLPVNPLIFGGAQEKNYRSGTENLPAILAFKDAIEEALGETEKFNACVVLRNSVESAIKKHHQDCIIVAENTNRLANTSLIIHPYMTGEEQVIHFDMHDISVSNGSACSSGKVSASFVLQSMGFSQDTAKRALRVSLHARSCEGDIHNFLEIYKKLF